MNDREKIGEVIRSVEKSPTCLVRDGTIEVRKRGGKVFLTKVEKLGTLHSPSG